MDDHKPSIDKMDKRDAPCLESQVINDEAIESGLKRQLKGRHVQMISIGGVIGTGLFLGTAGALQSGGPLGLFLGYAVIASICWAVMVSLGEMVTQLPIPGGHISLTQRFVGPSASFTAGWIYWYAWTIVIPAELSAAAILISYWDTKTNPGVYIAVCLIVAIAINLGGAGVYGEVEFWFASIKVITIVGLIILSIILTAGGGPSGDSIGFRYWNSPSPFQQYRDISGSLGRFLSFWSVLIPASFAMIGCEITAIAAGEAKNPRKTIPRAIRAVYIRIILFYLCSTFLIGLLVNPNDDRLGLASGTALSSPFVIAVSDAGIRALPSIINACLLTSAWSAASSDVFTSSRALHGMALRGHAPKIFAKTTSWGVPICGISLVFAISLLAFMSLGTTASRVFGWFATMTAVSGLSAWTFISIAYLRFYNGLKAQGISRETLAYKSPWQPYAAYYVLTLTTIIIFFNGWSVFLRGNWDTASFITSYLPVAMIFIIYFGHSLYTKSRIVKPLEIDFFSGAPEDVEDELYQGTTQTVYANIRRLVFRRSN